MAFLQTHDLGLKVLRQLKAYTNPLPHDLIRQQTWNNDRPPAVLGGFTALQVMQLLFSGAFYLSFRTSDKGWFKPQEIWKSPRDTLSSFGLHLAH